MKYLVLLVGILFLAGCKNVEDLKYQIDYCQKKTKEVCSWVVLPQSASDEVIEIYKKYGIVGEKN